MAASGRHHAPDQLRRRDRLNPAVIVFITPANARLVKWYNRSFVMISWGFDSLSGHHYLHQFMCNTLICRHCEMLARICDGIVTKIFLLGLLWQYVLLEMIYGGPKLFSDEHLYGVNRCPQF